MAGIHYIFFFGGGDFYLGATARENSHSSLHFVVGEPESLCTRFAQLIIEKSNHLDDLLIKAFRTDQSLFGM